MLHGALPIRTAGASAISHEHYLYVVGGYSPSSGSLDMLVRCDTGADGSCQRLSPMSERKYHSASVLRVRDGVASIVVCGGYHETVYSSCESYSIGEDRWASFPAMAQKRCSFALVEWRDRLFAIGGHYLGYSLDTIEEYDDKRGRWNLLKTELPTARRSHAALVY